MSEAQTLRPQRMRLDRAEHPISRSLLSANVLKVLYRLHGAGFVSYLVGGAVRDLLLGRKPKDFDVGTDARPPQVRRLFRNARLIGRRFRLALVTFAGETVEVATFRRSPEPPDIEEPDADVLAPVAESEEYGSPEEDAFRRDFTVNGLFYDISDFSVIDHVGGLRDLELGVIRTIGSAPLRFAEDPVRMMRAVEYAARLSFAIDDETADAIAAMRAEIHRAAPARITYELVESLKGGNALPILRGLEQHELLAQIAPEAHAAMTRSDLLLDRLLAAGDGAIARGDAVPEEAMLGALLLPGFLTALGWPGQIAVEAGTAERIAREQVEPFALRLSLSNFRGHVLRHALTMLPRLLSPPKTGKVVVRSVRHEAFPTAWQFARFLAEASGLHGECISSWQQALDRLQGGQPPVDEPAPRAGSAKRPRRRRRRKGGRQLAAAEKGTAA